MPSWWTEERVTELKTRWTIGESARQIWCAMGAVSRSAVIGKVHRLKLPFRATKHNNSAKRSNANRHRHSRKTVHHVDGRVFIVRGEAMTEDPIPPSFVNPKTIMQLRDHHCRWPGTGRGIDMLYCAAHVVDGYSYCAAHCRIAFAPYLPRPPKAPRS
jgi:GcrA cell cycle regulator